MPSIGGKHPRDLFFTKKRVLTPDLIETGIKTIYIEINLLLSCFDLIIEWIREISDLKIDFCLISIIVRLVWEMESQLIIP